MATIEVYAVFFCGGAVFANVVPVTKFLFLAPFLTAAYCVCNLLGAGGLEETLFKSAIAFALIQLGFVVGLAIRLSFANVSRHGLMSHYHGVIEEKTKTK